MCAGLPDGGRKPSLIEFVNHVMIYENTYAFVMLIKSKLDVIRNTEVNSASLYHIFAVVLRRGASCVKRWRQEEVEAIQKSGCFFFCK